MAWSRLECEAIIEDYFSMLAKELAGQSFSKAKHNRNLQPLLNDRSKGSIEYKHQNISAVLLKHGHTCIAGYEPAWNYQSLLEQVILERLENDSAWINVAEETLIDSLPTQLVISDWQSLLVEAPELVNKSSKNEVRKFTPHNANYAEREFRNRKLGELGEQFVIEFEKTRLCSIGRDDLVNDIDWVSKTKGDGAGYDIRSFDGETDKEIFIEVKTTNSVKYQPFLISANEVSFSIIYHDQYELYRVFQFMKEPRLFKLKGNISSYVNLEPELYKAKF